MWKIYWLLTSFRPQYLCAFSHDVDGPDETTTNLILCCLKMGVKRPLNPLLASMPKSVICDNQIT